VPNPDIAATYGEVEFGASRSMRRQMKFPKKGWYVWPSDINSLEAFMCGSLRGPFENEREARIFADKNRFEKVTQ
jgi:hypothetical protein